MLLIRQISRCLFWCLAITGITMADLLPGSSVDRGKHLFTSICFECHGSKITPVEINNPDYVPTPEAIRGAMSRVLPMRGNPAVTSLTDADLSNISLYLSKPATTDADRVFDWGEKTFPDLLAGAAQKGSYQSYYLRFYPATQSYVATIGDVTTGGQLYYYDTRSKAGIVPLGSIESFLTTVQAAGF
jgi:cytochrome c1